LREACNFYPWRAPAQAASQKWRPANRGSAPDVMCVDEAGNEIGQRLSKDLQTTWNTDSNRRAKKWSMAPLRAACADPCAPNRTRPRGSFRGSADRTCCPKHACGVGPRLARMAKRTPVRARSFQQSRAPQGGPSAGAGPSARPAGGLGRDATPVRACGVGRPSARAVASELKRRL